MTFNQFFTEQNLRLRVHSDDTVSIIKASGKVLKNKASGKVYEGYKTDRAALNDLENDLVRLGVLTPA